MSVLRGVIDYRFVVGNAVLFVAVAMLFEVTVSSPLFYSGVGIKFLVMCVEAFFVVVFFLLDKGDSLRLPRNKCYALFLLWLLWIGLSVVNSLYFAASLVRFNEVILHVLFLYTLFQFFQIYPLSKFIVKNFILIGFVLYTIFFIVGYYLARTISDVEFKYAFVGVGNVRYFGVYCTIVLLVAFDLVGRALAGRVNVSLILYLLISVAAWCWLFVLGGRGPFFAILSALCFVTLVKRSYFNPRYIILIALTMVCGLMLSIPLSPDGYGADRLVSTLSESSSIDSYSSGRLSIWRDVFEFVRHNPFFGGGPDGYTFHIGQFKHFNTSHPHGIVPQVIVEWGLPGAILFIILVFYGLKYVTHKIVALDSDVQYITGSYLSVLGVMFFSLVDGVLYHAVPTLLFVVLLAILLSDIVCSIDFPKQGNRRSAIRVFTVIPLVVLVMHFLSIASVVDDSIPPYDSKRVSHIRNFPSVLVDPMLSTKITRWGKTWENTISVSDVGSWYELMERYSSRSWLHAYMHSAFLLENDRSDEAGIIREKYQGISPGYIQDAFECLESRMGGAILADTRE